MTDACSFDFETRSRIDLLTRGAWIYAEHESTDALLASFRFNGGPVQRWRPGQPMPPDLLAWVRAGKPIYAWNASFERLIWNHVMTQRYGWPRLPLRQFRDTASIARALSLPGSLENIAKALDLPAQKDKRGKALIKAYSIPQEDGTFRPLLGDDLEAFHAYCDQDVLVEDAARERMVPLSDAEWEVYWMSERINNRGIGIDRTTCHGALRIIDQARDSADEQIHRITGGAVETSGQVARLVDWIRKRGVAVESAAKTDLEAVRDDPAIPDDVREVIDLRLLASKSSVGKVETMLARTSPDGRSRHCFIYHSAGTGRFSSVGWQAHNLPRPRKEFAKAKVDLDVAAGAIRVGEADLLPMLYGDVVGKPLHFVSDMLRSFLVPAPGCELIVADYSGIEGAVTAWFCGEEWKLAAMRELLTPEGESLPDLYIRTAAGIYGVPAGSIDKEDARRQTGKVSELSMGYQGGVSAFYAMSRNYELVLEEVYGPVWNATPDERREAALKRHAECTKKGHASTKQLSEKAWLAAELVKVGWRAVHPAIQSSWKMLQDACFEAVESPGDKVHAFSATFLVANGFLWLRLPTGRVLAFAAPRVREITAPWADMNEPPPKREKMPAVTVLGTEKGKLTRYALYGGLLLENIVQAVARDIMVFGMMNAERLGYPTVLHVHDEAVAEIPIGFGSDDEYRTALLTLPPGCEGLPLGVGKIHRLARYRKA